MAKNKLFVPITLRFSLINDQHVEVMNMLDELAETDKRSKNQIVMDALEYYFRQGTDEETSSRTYIDTATFESRLSEKREKLRLEIYQDVIRFIAGSALSGGVKTVILEPEDRKRMIAWRILFHIACFTGILPWNRNRN